MFVSRFKMSSNQDFFFVSIIVEESNSDFIDVDYFNHLLLSPAQVAQL